MSSGNLKIWSTETSPQLLCVCLCCLFLLVLPSVCWGWFSSLLYTWKWPCVSVAISNWSGSLGVESFRGNWASLIRFYLPAFAEHRDAWSCGSHAVSTKLWGRRPTRQELWKKECTEPGFLVIWLSWTTALAWITLPQTLGCSNSVWIPRTPLAELFLIIKSISNGPDVINQLLFLLLCCFFPLLFSPLRFNSFVTQDSWWPFSTSFSDTLLSFFNIVFISCSPSVTQKGQNKYLEDWSRVTRYSVS